jgi:hypothetical protein
MVLTFSPHRPTFLSASVLGQSLSFAFLALSFLLARLLEAKSEGGGGCQPSVFGFSFDTSGGGGFFFFSVFLSYRVVPLFLIDYYFVPPAKTNQEPNQTKAETLC